ncbi:hypothetical protein DFP72DRAFT_784611, partial [Ephemerocybe angulata]
RGPSIPWDKHIEWVQAAIRYIQENPTFRLKLFSDSTGEAKAEGRKKVANADGKLQLYQDLANVIF